MSKQLQIPGIGGVLPGELIVDLFAGIGMRMLEPHELAAAQGFPVSYVLTGTKAQRVARVGNSVCPPVAEAVVRAQFAAEIAAGRGRKGVA